MTIRELIELLTKCSPETPIYVSNNSTPMSVDGATIELCRVGMRGKSLYWVNSDPEWGAETFDSVHVGLILNVSKIVET